jgi:Tol biopolymer transport system component
MTSDRFDRTVAEWLHDDAEHHLPDHLADVLARTSRTRQRPWWSSPERWLPMHMTLRLAPVPRVVWMLVILALILALTVVALTVGSRPRLPSPFGPRAHGTVLYAATDGDIYALDTATNQARPLITGPAIDRDPSYSPDGTRFIFNRQESESASAITMIANADASDVRVLYQLTGGPGLPEWSPNGDRVLVIGDVGGSQGLFTIALDGTLATVFAAPATSFISEAHWLPNGQEIVFLVGTYQGPVPVGLYAIRADGTGMHQIIAPVAPGPAQLAVAPDGTRLAYSLVDAGRTQIHIVNLDTNKDAVVAFAGDAADRHPQWSPDGRSLVFERSTGDSYHLAVAAAEGGPVVELGPARPINTGGAQAQFSSDGTKVLARYQADRSSWILDPTDGSATQLSETIASPFTANRTAP